MFLLLVNRTNLITRTINHHLVMDSCIKRRSLILTNTNNSVKNQILIINDEKYRI